MRAATPFLIVPAVIASALLAACGSDSATSAPATATVPATTATAPAGTPAGSTAAGAVVNTASTSSGTVLVDASNGMTLYTFDSDTPGSGTSNCSGACASQWPALTVPSGTAPGGGSGVSGKLTTITRSDGTIQVAYNGKPLYHFSGDSKPGDTNGHYPGWSLATP